MLKIFLISASGLPSPTITWWLNGSQIGRQILEKNFKIRGLRTAQSELFVLPTADRSVHLEYTFPLQQSFPGNSLENTVKNGANNATDFLRENISRYYTDYECRARNVHGEARAMLALRVASVPGPIRQVVLEKVTATTVMLRFVPPQSSGGLNITSYIAQYKESRQAWSEARKRYWFQQSEGTFELGNLQPWKSYDIRFGCSNLVGVSPWGEQLQITLPQPSTPDTPVIFINGQRLEDTLDTVDTAEDSVVEVSSNSSTELSWERPESNGASIDFYRVEQSRVGEGEGETNRTVGVTLVSSSAQRAVTLGETESIIVII